MDLIARAHRLPRVGESLLGSRYATAPGGKGANQAIAAAQQGARTAIGARVGADALGEELRTSLARKGVDVTWLRTDPQLPTGLCPVLMDENGDYASIIIPGAGGALTIDDIDQASIAIQSCKVLMLQLEIGIEASEAAARIAKLAGGFVVLNAAPAVPIARAYAWPIWRNVDLLIVNRIEAQALAGVEASSRNGEGGAARALCQQYGVPATVMTLGPDGAVLATATMETLCPGYRAPVVDTIGAGDAFAGAMAAAVCRGDDLAHAVEIGVAASAIAVQREGAYDACPTLLETMDFARRRPV